ncbi:MAG: hypothetical protein RLZZ436_683 [Planctomycetota bacterium]|jgi:hypothetical protein
MDSARSARFAQDAPANPDVAAGQQKKHLKIDI